MTEQGAGNWNEKVKAPAGIAKEEEKNRCTCAMGCTKVVI
jgi:hypothetical protein